MKTFRISYFLFLTVMLVFSFWYFYARNTQTYQNATQEINRLKENIKQKNRLLEKAFGTKVENRPVYSKIVTATAYSARAAETDSTPETTASNHPTRMGIIATSDDLQFIGLTFGVIVFVEDLKEKKLLGAFIVDDRMNKRIKNTIDILHANAKAAKLFGKRKVKITWIGKGVKS